MLLGHGRVWALALDALVTGLGAQRALRNDSAVLLLVIGSAALLAGRGLPLSARRLRGVARGRTTRDRAGPAGAGSGAQGAARADRPALHLQQPALDQRLTDERCCRRPADVPAARRVPAGDAAAWVEQRITLADELALAERFLAIEQVRLGARLQVTRETDPQAVRLPRPAAAAAAAGRERGRARHRPAGGRRHDPAGGHA